MSNFLISKKHSILKRRYSLAGFEVNSMSENVVDALVLEKKGLPYIILVGNENTLDAVFELCRAVLIESEVKIENTVDVVFVFNAIMLGAGITVNFVSSIDARLANGIPIEFNSDLFPTSFKFSVKVSPYNELYVIVIDDIDTDFYVDIIESNAIAQVVTMYSNLVFSVPLSVMLGSGLAMNVNKEILLSISCEVTNTGGEVFIVNSETDHYIHVSSVLLNGKPIEFENDTVQIGFKFSVKISDYNELYILVVDDMETNVYIDIHNSNAITYVVHMDSVTEGGLLVDVVVGTGLILESHHDISTDLLCSFIMGSNFFAELFLAVHRIYVDFVILNGLNFKTELDEFMDIEVSSKLVKDFQILYVQAVIDIFIDLGIEMVTANGVSLGSLIYIYSDFYVNFEKTLAVIFSSSMDFDTLANAHIINAVADHMEIHSGNINSIGVLIRNSLGLLFRVDVETLSRIFSNIVIIDFLDVDVESEIKTDIDVLMYRITWVRLEHLDDFSLSDIDSDSLEDLYRTEEI